MGHRTRTGVYGALCLSAALLVVSVNSLRSPRLEGAPALRGGATCPRAPAASLRGLSRSILGRSPGINAGGFRGKVFAEGSPGVWRAPPVPGDRGYRAQRAGERKPLGQLEVNTQHKGTICTVKNFGAFVDIGYNKDGLLPARELQKIQALLKADNFEALEGTPVDVTVVEIDEAGGRFLLRSMISSKKQQQQLSEELPFQEGDVVKGNVVSMVKFGAFVDLGVGKDALLHTSWLKSKEFSSGVSVGETIDVKIIKIDRQQNKIILGAPSGSGQASKMPPPPQPQQDFSKYKEHINTRPFRATVVALRNFGAILQLEDGVKGLLPTRFAAPNHIDHVMEVLQEGQKIDVYILGIDDRGISFSCRQITGEEKNRKKNQKTSGQSIKSAAMLGGGGMGKEMKALEAELSGAPVAVQAAPAPAEAKSEDTTPVVEDEVEVEERVYKGVTYLVDPSTNELYSEDGEVLGEWDGAEPVFY